MLATLKLVVHHTKKKTRKKEKRETKKLSASSFFIISHTYTHTHTKRREHEKILFGAYKQCVCVYIYTYIYTHLNIAQRVSFCWSAIIWYSSVIAFWEELLAIHYTCATVNDIFLTAKIRFIFSFHLKKKNQCAEQVILLFAYDKRSRLYVDTNTNPRFFTFIICLLEQ